MNASAILVLTALAVVLVLAVALLTGSLALLVGGQRQEDHPPKGIAAAIRLVDRQWRVERLIYRHHRWFGSLILLTGAFCIWQMARTEMIDLLNGPSPASALIWMLLLGQAFNLLVGIVILLRPSLLKPVESLSNRWHQLKWSSYRHPRNMRAAAVLLSLVGLLVLLATTTLIIQQITQMLD